jgi:hypothetical protein
MKMSSIYEDLYRDSQEKSSGYLFRLGYMEASIHRLKRLIESERVKADKYDTATLIEIANVYETAKLEAIKYQEEADARKAKQASL